MIAPFVEEIHLDHETKSLVDLNKHGVFPYAFHPSHSILMTGYTKRPVGAPEIQLTDIWLPEKPFPEWVTNHDGRLYFAHNALFEIVNWWAAYRRGDWPCPPPPLSQWRDTMAQAAAMALPLALGQLSEVFGLDSDTAKDKRGKELINMFSVPDKKTGEIMCTPESHPAEWLEYQDYCKQDTVAEVAIGDRMLPLSDSEQKVWELDQQINMRGLPVDRDSAQKAIALLSDHGPKLDAEVQELTEGVIKSARATSLRMWLNDNIALSHLFAGTPFVEIPNLKKDTVADVLKDAHKLPDTFRRLLEIRTQSSKSSTAKFTSLLNVSPHRSRAFGCFQYHAASTGRWGGREFQPHNLPSRDIFPAHQAEKCIEHLDDRDMLNWFSPNTHKILSSIIRGMIQAPEGKRLMVGDYKSIEAIVLAWLAGQHQVLDLFRNNKNGCPHCHGEGCEHCDVYLYTAQSIPDATRNIGKVATLALGYGGGVGAFQVMAASYGVVMEDEDADLVKKNWRYANPEIVNFWYKLEADAYCAILDPNQLHGDFFYHKQSNFLFYRLPSGRRLSYALPHIRKKLMPWSTEENQDWRDAIHYWGVKTSTKGRRWMRLDTYGGKLCENITQAVARDILAEGLLRVEAAGYPVIGHVHDEAICEVDNNFGNVEEFQQLLETLPAWAEGMPLIAECEAMQRYKK